MCPFGFLVQPKETSIISFWSVQTVQVHTLFQQLLTHGYCPARQWTSAGVADHLLLCNMFWFPRLLWLWSGMLSASFDWKVGELHGTGNLTSHMTFEQGLGGTKKFSNI